MTKLWKFCQVSAEKGQTILEGRKSLESFSYDFLEKKNDLPLFHEMPEKSCQPDVWSERFERNWVSKTWNQKYEISGQDNDDEDDDEDNNEDDDKDDNSQ